MNKAKVAGLPKILVVDDDPELPTIIEAAMSGTARIVRSHNWRDAGSLLSKERFALILLDLFLPDAEPLEPLREIREIDMDYPVVIMSGNVDESSPLFDHIMRLGVNSILPKPFNLKKLEAEISAHLGGLLDK